MHRHNTDERHIRTFKDHFRYGLASFDLSFYLHAWCFLVLSAKTTIKLLRIIHLNSKLLAYAQMHDNFDFKRTPLDPPGMKVVAHY